MGQFQNNSETAAAESFDRTQELTWALLDECINGEEFAELENRLLNERSARETYVGCIQLHTDLARHFADQAATSTPARRTNTPILGFLGTDSGPLTGLNTPKS
jgi:hypothetical protein